MGISDTCLAGLLRKSGVTFLYLQMEGINMVMMYDLKELGAQERQACEAGKTVSESVQNCSTCKTEAEAMGAAERV